MKTFRRRVKKLRQNIRKFMMSNSPRPDEHRGSGGILRWRLRDDPQPNAPPLDVPEADDNHNEINSNYLPSMEPRPRLYPDLAQLEPEVDLPIDSSVINGDQDDASERHYFDNQSGFYEGTAVAAAAAPDDSSSNQQHEDTVDNAPDAFTEAAQNDYNSEVERIMQESRQLQATQLQTRRRQIPNPQNTGTNRTPFPVEVDLVGVEASTSLFLLGFVLVFVSRWYAVLYLAVVSYLLYRMRARVHQEALARAEAQAHFQFPVPQVITDLQEALKLVVQSVAMIVLVPLLIVGGLAALARLWSSSSPRGRHASPPSPTTSPDCKFLLQLMFFPVFIPYWMSKLRASHPRGPPTLVGSRGGSGGGGGGHWAALRALGRLLGGAGRR